ncbi:hypothetical protein [Streptomyces lavenduligriseus]|uniref:Uncharacterized protein n=1 Tax=Streptomyces lavenduligriseus TaxID=67315 RepID=A0ABT0P3B3_9ACTN|nr:hypothetical protein [Streptomyces lavenduligriseus]MCL3998095.1 hypothetical protein [Streptomyces lavenduligriseus]
MQPSLDPLTVQRLAYVRYLYREGIEQSRQPAPLRSRAITSFHDAVENFIGLVAQHLGAELKKNTEFLGYWEAVKPFELPKKEQMKRLNDARVALKHNGTFPSEHQIEQARETLADFFATVTPKVFGVDFDAVDMVDLLTQPEAARLVREAQTHADIGDYPMAMAGLVLAFDALLDHYAAGDRPAGKSPFKFGARLYRGDVVQLQNAGNSQINPRLKKLGEFAIAAQDALRVISLGIDYPSLARFRVMTPPVYGYGDGSQRFVDLPSVRTLNADDYDWARHFVIESGLRASRADEIRGMQERAHELNWNPREPFGERSWQGPVELTPDEGVSVFEDEALDG